MKSKAVKITNYMRSTGEIIKIKQMKSSHLYNARNLVKRTIYTKLHKNGIELINKGFNQPLYDALNEELKTRPTNEYLKPIYTFITNK
tara:strand:- start:32495 stop:32758 length:264 start_codon:yes stop_codon:yes gene_type:complete